MSSSNKEIPQQHCGTSVWLWPWAAHMAKNWKSISEIGLRHPLLYLLCGPDYGHQLRQKAFVLSRRVLRTYYVVSDPQINFAKPAENWWFVSKATSYVEVRLSFNSIYLCTYTYLHMYLHILTLLKVLSICTINIWAFIGINFISQSNIPYYLK